MTTSNMHRKYAIGIWPIVILLLIFDKFNQFKAARKQRKLERQALRQAKKDSIENLKTSK